MYNIDIKKEKKEIMMMKDMYVIEKELHHIGGIEIKIANADLFDAESGEWIGHVAKEASDAKLEFWYRDASDKVRFIVEMEEYDGTAVYDVFAKTVAKAIVRKSARLIAMFIGWLVASAAGGIVEGFVGSLLGF